ncbi:response regulator [bacterium]|nr:response regulator [bacterium]
MNNTYQETDETTNIFKEESEQILRDFAIQLDLFTKTKDINIVTKLMRDAHSVKGSAGIAGFINIQNKAHKIEDILTLIKKEYETNDFNESRAQIGEIQNLIVEIAHEFKEPIIKKGDITNEKFYNTVLKKISSLKSDISVANELAQQMQKISEQKNDISDIANILYKIFSKIKRTQDINSNIINTISGALKIIKKVIIDKNPIAKEELFFIQQRLSIVEQMFVSSKNNINTKPKEKLKETSSDIMPDIFKILGQESIKTLRIETTKLDKLYENVINLENIAEKKQNYNDSIKNLMDTLSSKIFEIEKISSKIKNIEIKNKQNKTIMNSFSKEIKCLENSIKNIQNEFFEYEKIQKDNEENAKEFDECIQQVQDTVKKIRILPIGVILHMFPRMVRDIAKSLNKEITMEIKGSETGVDKKIIEEIKMPLIHLLRNAVDHGIEMPEERKKLGKPNYGKISISAKNQGEKFIISIKDDGCGINFDKIKEKALKEKLLCSQEIKKYKRQDFLNILFKPGFSTEDKVTELSGRGIGLDIVYTQIMALNGQVKISTTKGKGTEIILTVPSGYYTEKNNEKIKRVRNILFVDDSRTTLTHFSKILNKAGYNVCTKNNARDGLKELKKGCYDILISDVEMPEINGVEFISQIRQDKDKKIQEIPVIILSMLEKEKAEKLFKNINISQIINKSEIKEDSLLSILKTILC